MWHRHPIGNISIIANITLVNATSQGANQLLAAWSTALIII